MPALQLSRKPSNVTNLDTNGLWEVIIAPAANSGRILGYAEVILADSIPSTAEQNLRQVSRSPNAFREPVILCVPNDSLSLLCRGSSHPLDALPAYPVRPSSQSPVQDLSTAYSGKKGRRHAKRQP
jgi:hypothetical protein